jgi:hypothetical protein
MNTPSFTIVTRAPLLVVQQCRGMLGQSAQPNQRRMLFHGFFRQEGGPTRRNKGRLKAVWLILLWSERKEERCAHGRVQVQRGHCGCLCQIEVCVCIYVYIYVYIYIYIYVCVCGAYKSKKKVLYTFSTIRLRSFKQQDAMQSQSALDATRSHSPASSARWSHRRERVRDDSALATSS